MPIFPFIPSLKTANASAATRPSGAKRVASELPAGRLAVVPGAAHAAHYAAPRSVARTVRRFIDEQPASRLAVA